MRKQIAAANWKMNCTYQQGEELLDNILGANIELADHRQVVFAVPFPYLIMANYEVADEKNYFIAAQNCYNKKQALLRAKYQPKCSIQLALSIAYLGIVSVVNISRKAIKCWPGN